MAEEEDKPKKHTLESLFHLYANHRTYATDLDNVQYDNILLSQIDYWMEQAKLLRVHFSLTDTGRTYMKFRKWRLDFEDFLEFLTMLCVGKKITVNDVKDQLVAAGLPGAVEVIVLR